ncbi:MAG: carboxypeptidase-like regulatory domain-containing protein, partial [Candidatus Kapabacteria bacterium]|nr:carboxypeptidase-like regulatory domain-containing protein [Candidatus Kapabacteria bacterium]
MLHRIPTLILILAAQLISTSLVAQGIDEPFMRKTSLQTLRGTVTDAVTNAPIVGVSVAVFSDDNRTGKAINGAITNGKGEFRIKNVPIGRYAIRISSVAYEQATADVVLTAGKEAVLNFQLTEKYTAQQTVEVTASRTDDLA